MPSIRVRTAVVQDTQILLVKRQDVSAWDLPAGGIEANESAVEAAIRETYEETGLKVAITHLVGLYSLPLWGNEGSHVALFAARVIGGELRLQSGETVKVNFFEPDQLPSPIGWWHYQQIQDALQGVGGSIVRSQKVRLPERSDLTPEQLYTDYWRLPKPADQVLEVAGRTLSSKTGDHHGH
jgi:ADP-ribose pyrophosphatase YjhB (NUDIX family)